ncbi:solute carrier family 25 member 38 [Saitoella complicata NRRL Y-17804]|uniref:Mitochondrial glycine transporter n=1 Tax=Saitoella complicata (strain BCRC 22490 / CBS 7301 / JCM 7358 / NBRC 10748 / NRRL Y-17804) TaxID=698492 RepID=A0A0E9NB56_SAICN|nr:solute carrier family 25 member 38 [Saitoella complicata NRRL Y-17804]ODQ50451.1 solute carrier family 25 member 38 [Saitoella complicata NRRL Y-17804]GAO46640.1 hypothetical protein G7K_0866-t1 [Saitoella complicata NRRL Y-17804]
MSSSGNQQKRNGLTHFLSGASSGLITSATLQPLDLLKTRRQQGTHGSLVETFHHVVKTPADVVKLWRGTLPSTIRTGLGSAMYFASLNHMRQYFSRHPIAPATESSGKNASALPRLSKTANLTTGAFARAAVGFIMMPITIIKVRYESNYYSYSSMMHATKDILKNDGMKGFFYGFGATAIRDAPYAGIYVLFYEQCKLWLTPINTTGSNEASASKAVVNMTSGVIAGVSATVITNPFDVLRTRMQVRPQDYRNTWQAARKLIVEDGMKVFGDGMGLRVARKALSSAITWTIYEELVRWSEKTSQELIG